VQLNSWRAVGWILFALGVVLLIVGFTLCYVVYGWPGFSQYATQDAETLFFTHFAPFAIAAVSFFVAGAAGIYAGRGTPKEGVSPSSTSQVESPSATSQQASTPKMGRERTPKEWVVYQSTSQAESSSATSQQASTPKPESPSPPFQSKSPSPTYQAGFPPLPQQSPCPYCGKPMVLIEKYQRWYCPNEKKYI
jgi:hypothetical protein